ncbi:MAG: hypothetical protein ABIY37_15470 [Devosia sp.]
MTRSPTAVIPAKAGTQTAFTDNRALRLDSRLRGNDEVGGEVLDCLIAIRQDIRALGGEMLDFRIGLEGMRQQLAAIHRSGTRMHSELVAINDQLDRIEHGLDSRLRGNDGVGERSVG